MQTHCYIYYVYIFSSFQVVYNIVAMSVAIVINANPLLHMLCIYILWEEPTSTDIMGKYIFNWHSISLQGLSMFASK